MVSPDRGCRRPPSRRRCDRPRRPGRRARRRRAWPSCRPRPRAAGSPRSGRRPARPACVAQSSRRQTSSSICSSEGSMVGSPTQAEPLPSAVRPTRLTAAGRLHVREPHPGRAAEIQRRHVLLGEARQDGVAGPGPPEGARQGRQHALERARVGLLGSGAEVAVPAGSAPARPGRRRRRPAAPPARRPGRPPPSRPRRRLRRRRSAGRCRPTRRPARSRSPSGPRCTPLVVVVFSAKRTSAWLLSSTSTMQPSAPQRRRAAARPRSTSSWAGITARPHAPPTLNAPTPRVRSARARRGRAPRGSRGRPAPPGRAGPCRS